MLKINQIYLYGSKHYIAIIDKKKIKGKYVYTARRVKASGQLGSDFKVKYSKDKFTPVKATMMLIVDLPKTDRDKIRYENVIDSSQELVDQYKKLKKTNPRRISFQRDIGRLAFSVTSIYCVEKGRFYNFRDFAKSLKFKRYKTLYSWVLAYLKTQFVEAKYKNIRETATSTLKECLNNYQKNWKSLVGFDKAIDEIILRDFSEYKKELLKRGEKLYA